jgi:hypothetical protein
MTYFFSDPAGLQPFNQLSTALGKAGRKLALLPPVQRGVYEVHSTVAAPRIKAGADVLPWWPTRGVYVLLEQGAAEPTDLVGVEGVAGAWTASALPVDPSLASAQPGQSVTYLFLDDDPVSVADRLESVLPNRWRASGVKPLLAAPFYPVVPYEWDRYVP